MKIALCLYGSEFYKDSFNGIKIVLDILSSAGHTVDIFFHTWSERDETDLLSCYNPKMHMIEKKITFADDKEKNNTYLQCYSMTMVRNILMCYCVSNKIIYDGVIATRFDILFSHFPKINSPSDFNKIKSPKQYYIYRPLIFDSNIIICNYENFTKLFNIFPNLNRLCEKGPRNHMFNPSSTSVPSSNSTLDIYKDSDLVQDDLSNILKKTQCSPEMIFSAMIIDCGLFDYAEKSNDIQYMIIGEEKLSMIDIEIMEQIIRIGNNRAAFRQEEADSINTVYNKLICILRNAISKREHLGKYIESKQGKLSDLCPEEAKETKETKEISHVPVKSKIVLFPLENEEKR